MFIDELKLFVQSGSGGNGCVSFRREKYVARGGPDGGDGGKGGDVVVRVAPKYNTLMPLRNQRHYRAEDGKRGRGSNMTGASGETLYLDVPKGTLVRDFESGTLLANLTQAGEESIIAKGGQGGKGNAHFTTASRQAPKFAQEGQKGVGFWAKFELKVMADVGLVGFPNAGKSTLIRQVSSANPKVASYPFTTLVPNLGVVKVGAWNSFVMADIPGLIEGAHEGLGLGHRFLRHIERTRLLLILLDPTDPERSMDYSWETINLELNKYSDILDRKKRVAIFTKSDLKHDRAEEIIRLKQRLEAENIPSFSISSFDLEALNELVYSLFELLTELETSGMSASGEAFDRTTPPQPRREEGEVIKREHSLSEEASTSKDPLDEL
ncbi:MAG: GTPase ObgE [Acidobacteria bacterium]|nr:MAG: GTPase ObgE [Acidobacteriota bacterium]